ncbi:HAD-IIA family hydrolase [Halococcus sediminicola]|uniref:HAD-IIA family hydrolase n=1 Tax=Halococcus sediminicola TaxID=1264579 RepID=UPI0006794A74|nr:HAD-IIA family hydrolase [Halococcus sediminicola]
MPSRGAIVDLDGTVYRGDSPVPGARRGIKALRDAGYDVCFFSNNPTKSRTEFADRLQGMGLSVAPEEIESAATVTVDYLAAEHADDRIFLVGSSGLRAQFERADLTLTDDPEACDVLVASYTRGFDYDDMTDGLRALEADATFVGTDPDVTIPTEGGAVPGSGAIINAIAGVAEREPDIVVGKPGERALTAALSGFDAAPEDCLVVGDRLDTDIAMGARGGLETALVLTGTTNRALLAASDIEPDHVLDSLGDVERVLNR